MRALARKEQTAAGVPAARPSKTAQSAERERPAVSGKARGDLTAGWRRVGWATARRDWDG